MILGLAPPVVRLGKQRQLREGKRLDQRRVVGRRPLGRSAERELGRAHVSAQELRNPGKQQRARVHRRVPGERGCRSLRVLGHPPDAVPAQRCPEQEPPRLRCLAAAGQPLVRARFLGGQRPAVDLAHVAEKSVSERPSDRCRLVTTQQAIVTEVFQARLDSGEETSAEHVGPEQPEQPNRLVAIADLPQVADRRRQVPRLLVPGGGSAAARDELRRLLMRELPEQHVPEVAVEPERRSFPVERDEKGAGRGELLEPGRAPRRPHDGVAHRAGHLVEQRRPEGEADGLRIEAAQHLRLEVLRDEVVRAVEIVRAGAERRRAGLASARAPR